MSNKFDKKGNNSLLNLQAPAHEANPSAALRAADGFASRTQARHPNFNRNGT